MTWMKSLDGLTRVKGRFEGRLLRLDFPDGWQYIRVSWANKKPWLGCLCYYGIFGPLCWSRNWNAFCLTSKKQPLISCSSLGFKTLFLSCRFLGNKTFILIIGSQTQRALAWMPWMPWILLRDLVQDFRIMFFGSMLESSRCAMEMRSFCCWALQAKKSSHLLKRQSLVVNGMIWFLLFNFFEPRLWSPSCTMPIFCCPWAAELKVWITNIELLIRCERIPFVESCQAICPQGYSLQCVTLFFLFTTNSDWWLETVLLCAPVFSVLSTQAEVDSIQVALLEDDGSEWHLTLLAVRTIYLKVYIINVLLAKAAAVPVLWTLRRTETRIWRWEAGDVWHFPVI